MNKNAIIYWLAGIIILLVGGIASWLFFHQLPRLDHKFDQFSDQLKIQNEQFDKKFTDQEQRIEKLDKRFAIIVTALNSKIPNLNLPALFTLSDQKNIPANKINAVIELWLKNPDKAKAYLKNQLHLNNEEIKGLSMPASPNIQYLMPR